jgi:AIR synthase related protein
MNVPRSEVAPEKGSNPSTERICFSSILAFAMPMSEKALIARIRRKAVQGRSIVTGIGDDSAVLAIPEDHQALVTTDFSLEGIHFRREWHPPDSVGHRCLARGLSDIAAMGGEPVAAFLSLALPRNLPQKWVDGFMLGLLRLADEAETRQNLQLVCWPISSCSVRCRKEKRYCDPAHDPEIGST